VKSAVPHLLRSAVLLLLLFGSFYEPDQKFFFQPSGWGTLLISAGDGTHRASLIFKMNPDLWRAPKWIMNALADINLHFAQIEL
jgi:hypothetical protein